MITDLPQRLAPEDENGHSSLWHWRNNLDWTGTEAAVHLGIAPATYYRYEKGTNVSVRKANMIIRKTHGQLRYPDILPDFIKEYAR